MPKRIKCSGCGTGLHHKRRFEITEVNGVASGRTIKLKEKYCIGCYDKLSLK